MRNAPLGRWGRGRNLRAPPLPADYFSEHLGVYRPVLAALESLNRAVLAAMDTTKLVSERAVILGVVQGVCRAVGASPGLGS